MHVSPAQLRAVRRDDVLLHFAVLDGIVFALADFPATGSRGTFAEEWCDEQHWAFTVRGGLEIDLDGDRQPIEPGTAFHVPPGVRHRLVVPGEARVAGFDRLKPDAPIEDDALRRAGYDIVRSRKGTAAALALNRSRPEPSPAVGEIAATTRRMGDLLFTRARLGPRAGYTSSLCDLPHWGLVTSGSLAIEWEDDVEVVTAGDVFLCPAGPPGHRLQAADPATIVDFTPVAAFDGPGRVSNWRRAPAEAALAAVDAPRRIALVALA